MSEPISISVVTSCFNAEAYIEDTFKSVHNQNYPNLQHIIKDGGSKDSTLAIAEKYKALYPDDIEVISKPDKGQYYGIQQGFEYATGEVVSWLNADDIYYPWTFSVVNEIFTKYPEIDWIIGVPTFMNAKGQAIKISTNSASAFPQDFIRNGWFNAHLAGYLQQESMFWRKSLWDKVGGLNLDLSLAGDFDLWTRFAEHAELVEVVSPLACFRIRPGEQRSSKGEDKYLEEVARITQSKKTPPAVWETISKRGIVWRSLFRLLVWRKTKVIAFSASSQKWELRNLRRPVSRATMLDLMLEKSVRE